MCIHFFFPETSLLAFLFLLHYSFKSLFPAVNPLRASLVAQLVKNLPAMQETPVQFLGQEDPLEKG